MELEHTIPVFERAKTVHTLDHAATVIGSLAIYNILKVLPQLNRWNEFH
jgi:hypothetical protein